MFACLDGKRRWQQDGDGGRMEHLLLFGHERSGWFSPWKTENPFALQSTWSRNRQTVAQLWLGFLCYYAETFNAGLHVVQIRQSQPLSKFEKLWTGKSLAIEDPFDLNHNLVSGLGKRSTSHVPLICFIIWLFSVRLRVALYHPWSLDFRQLCVSRWVPWKMACPCHICHWLRHAARLHGQFCNRIFAGKMHERSYSVYPHQANYRIVFCLLWKLMAYFHIFLWWALMLH